jgi:hypothetical protein
VTVEDARDDGTSRLRYCKKQKSTVNELVSPLSRLLCA